MNWFKKKRTPSVEVTRSEDHDNRVEVVIHKNATDESFKKVDQANELLKELLVEDEVTFRIYLGTGGKNIKHKLKGSH